MSHCPIIKRRMVAIVTTLLEIFERFSWWIGSKPACGIEDSSLSQHKSSKIERQRYSLAEVLEGVTEGNMQALNHATAWAHQGTPVGEELT